MLDPGSQLMLKFKSGDTISFEKLVKEYREKIVNVIYQFIGDKEEAEDLAIEVFLRVYRARERYKPRAKFTTWLYKIAANLCLNEIRKKTRFQTVSLSESIPSEAEEKLMLIEKIADSSPSPQDILEEKERNTLIRKAIDSLPAKQRIAIVLQIYEGLSYKEISKILNCSVKSVERRLYRARTNLKEKLAPYLKGEKYNGGFLRNSTFI